MIEILNKILNKIKKDSPKFFYFIVFYLILLLGISPFSNLSKITPRRELKLIKFFSESIY